MVKITECDGKYVLLNEPGGERTTLLSGAPVPEFDTAKEAYDWATVNNFSVCPKEDISNHSDKAEKAAHEETDKAEREKDHKALLESHKGVLEKEHAKRQEQRVQRALDRLTDEELEAEIGRRRR